LHGIGCCKGLGFLHPPEWTLEPARSVIVNDFDNVNDTNNCTVRKLIGAWPSNPTRQLFERVESHRSVNSDSERGDAKGNVIGFAIFNFLKHDRKTVEIPLEEAKLAIGR
jgi:hypothetical protein